MREEVFLEGLCMVVRIIAVVLVIAAQPLPAPFETPWFRKPASVFHHQHSTSTQRLAPIERMRDQDRLLWSVWRRRLLI